MTNGGRQSILCPNGIGPNLSPILTAAKIAKLRMRTAMNSWRDSALCAQTDPALFFPEKGSPVAEAVKICQKCEVRVECLDFAIATKQRFGVWGGKTERERRVIRWLSV